MNPQEQLDQDVVNFAKATRQEESGGDPKIKGSSNEMGYYQYTPDTWNAQAKKYGVNVPIEQATPEQQNEVFYKWAKEKKDAGFNLGQISSMHNAGEGKPNAYKENWKGTNEYGVQYDTPAYAKRVAENYKKLKGQTQPDVSQIAPEKLEGKKWADKDLLEKAGSVANVASLGIGKTTGEAIGTLGGLAYEKLKGVFGGQDNSEYYDTSAPTPGQVLGDVAQGALTVGTSGLVGATSKVGKVAGIGEQVFGKTLPVLKTAATTAGRIGQTAGIGAGFGLSGGLKEGKTDVGELAKDTAIGGVLGGALGVVGESLSKIAKALPREMIQGKFDNLSDAEAQKFLQQNMGTKNSLLKQAEDIVIKEGNKIDKILKSSKYANYISKENPFSEVLQQFPEYQGREGQLVTKIKSFISQSSNIGEDRSTLLKFVDKIVNGQASLFEKNQIRKVLDLATKGGYAKLAKSINPSAGHDLAMTFADALRTEVKGVAKETIPIFEELQKSLNIRKAVQSVVNKKGSTALIRYADIIPFLGGNVIAPGVGGVGAVLANRAVENPATRFAGAKITQGILGGGGKTVENPLTIKTVQGLFGGNVNVKNGKEKVPK